MLVRRTLDLQSPGTLAEDIDVTHRARAGHGAHVHPLKGRLAQRVREEVRVIVLLVPQKRADIEQLV